MEFGSEWRPCTEIKGQLETDNLSQLGQGRQTSSVQTRHKSEALNELTEKKQYKQKGGSNQHKGGVIRGCDVIKTVAELVVPPDSEP